jgi:hypothetical protein
MIEAMARLRKDGRPKALAPEPRICPAHQGERQGLQRARREGAAPGADEGGL